jgi:precorrin-6B methylase 2
LEFGSGASTLWWSRRTREVVAIEHDAGWAQQVARDSSAQVIAVPATDAESYFAPARGRGAFEVIVIDGIFRPECILACREWLAPDGVIIVDDAQRAEYRTAIEEVAAAGFRCLPFHGPQPVSKHPGCTEVLYRDGNVLGI